MKGMSAKQELVQLFWGRQLRGEGAQGDNSPDRRRRICREPYMCSGPSLTSSEAVGLGLERVCLVRMALYTQRRMSLEKGQLLEVWIYQQVTG